MSDNMRELVKKQIIRSFENGLDELDISIINISRERNKKSLVIPLHIMGDNRIKDKINPEFDIKIFVNSLTNQELLDVVDSQACQAYR